MGIVERFTCFAIVQFLHSTGKNRGSYGAHCTLRGLEVSRDLPRPVGISRKREGKVSVVFYPSIDFIPHFRYDCKYKIPGPRPGEALGAVKETKEAHPGTIQSSPIRPARRHPGHQPDPLYRPVQVHGAQCVFKTGKYATYRRI